MKPDFSGYATKVNIRCSDGKTIMPDAFMHHDQTRVPLVWQHMHDDPANVLGHAILEHRADGTYARAYFNGSEKALEAKELVRHGDVNMMSIYANRLVKQGQNVVHGNICEVSLVLAGANPGAMIENVNIQHSDGTTGVIDEEAVIYSGLTLEHADNSTEGAPTVATGKTVADVIETMDKDQKDVLEFMVSEALENGGGDDDLEQSGMIDGEQFVEDLTESITHSITEGLTTEMRNLFATASEGSTLQHSALNGSAMGGSQKLEHSQVGTIMKFADRKSTKLSEAILAHADDYGITDIELLFPDARATSASPELLARQADWVPQVLNATKQAPYAKIKSIVADLTGEQARARGYVTGNQKTDEVISLLRRSTGPTTIYKKQKLDRDNIIDITDFDVVVWLKWEIRFMLNEEIARAILVGDGRSINSDDKIADPAGALSGDGIRSILLDNDLYAHKLELDANVSDDDIIDAVTLSRTDYRGSGNPTYYTTDKSLTRLLLLKDKMGRRLYDTEAALASALRVKTIVSVPVMEEYANLVGIVVNLIDYTVGTNKGGEISFFEDFDLDFNQNKYLMETRMSGALTKPKSAIVITREQGTEVTSVTAPSFNGTTNTISIPTTPGVDYTIGGDIKTGSVVITDDTTVNASAKAGYYLPSGATRQWTYSFTE